ncbi:hypothetical protein [Nocardiopsis composta]|uniref:Uncharacterized protein n=1 Tax=Nocardiopsis composta TaxID=157465 RepID=A0A7W8QI68_9ACTN|nr:hypothetical protein [Nocardiopsis composta]MBB5430942.1 hypothetical protein [Nocardiopsis composta]
MTEQLRRPFSEPGFWAGRFLDQYADGRYADEPPGGGTGADGGEPDRTVAEYDLGGGYALLVRAGHEETLELSHPGAERPVELGLIDLAHWFPHALRWSEIDLVCRAIALADPRSGHPGPPLVLLGRFAPVCTEDDAALALPLLREAFDALPGLDAYQRRSYPAHGDIRALGVHWQREGSTGWWYPDYSEQDPYPGDPDAEDYLCSDLYSGREPGSPDFPFAALDALVDRARARCAALRERPWAEEAAVRAAAEAFALAPSAAHRADLVGGLLAAGCADRAVLGALAPEAGRLRALVMAELLLGAEPGSLVRARAGSEAPRPLRRYYARAYLPVASAQAPRDGLASRLKPRLNAALRAAGAGSTEDGPSRHGSLDGRSFDCVPLELIGDWRAGVEVVREVLRAAGAPGHSTVEVRRRGEVVTVGLDQPLPGD